MEVTIEYAPIKCAGSSLIGVGRGRPTSWGNYFEIYAHDGEPCRVVNFWWENLASADKEFNLEGRVKIVRFRTKVPATVYGTGESYERSYDMCLIMDERIPDNWYYNALCFTGYGYPSIVLVKAMYDIVGDPENNFEQYSDPVSYWDKRGWHCEIKNGCMSRRRKITA